MSDQISIVNFEMFDSQDSTLSFEELFERENNRFNLERATFEAWSCKDSEIQLNVEVENIWKKIKKEVELEAEFYGYPNELIANRESLGPMLENLRCFFCKEFVRLPKSCRNCRQLFCKHCIEVSAMINLGIPCIALRGALCIINDVCISITQSLNLIIIKCGICNQNVTYDKYEYHRMECKKQCEECGLLNNGLGHECVNNILTSIKKLKEEFKIYLRELKSQTEDVKKLNENLINKDSEIKLLYAKLTHLRLQNEQLWIKRGFGGKRTKISESSGKIVEK